MPFLLPAAATAMAAAAPAVAASTAAATAGATLTSIATNIAMNVAISAVMSALQPPVGAAGRTSEWTLSPDAPIPFAAGRIGVAGSAVHRATFGPDLMYLGVPSVISGAGPIDGYETFRADDEFVTFDGNGKAVSSQYANELWFRKTLGNQPDVAVTSPPGLKNSTVLSGWGASHKLSGKAAYMVVMGENSKGTAFPTGEIKPLIVVRGLKGWDPRLDSTYPGGSGPCRLDNPATWVYLTNPILWALKWSLGLWEGPTLKGAPAHGSATDYQVGGIGAKLSGIDVPAFVACANVADANGWTVCAYPTTDDDKHAVLTSFLQAGGAIYASRAGKISCIQRAAPRTSIVTISAGDTAGPLEIDTAASRIDRINTIRPRMTSEGHRWQLTAIPEVTAQAYRDEDGGTRPRGIDYTYVSNATQAAQLAALQIANTREGIAGVVPLKPHLQKIKPGDAFTITEPGFVLNGLKCLCLSTDFDPSTKIVAVSFVSETDAKYPFALGQSQEPPEAPVLTPVDPRYVSPPGENEWQIVVRPPSVGGGQIPGFDMTGLVDNATATAILVEWGPTADGPWTQAYLGPPTVTTVPITGVQPGGTYFIAVRNIRDQNYSTRQVYGPYTAPALISEDTASVGGVPSDLFVGRVINVETLAAATAAQIDDVLDGFPSVIDAVDAAEAARDVSVVKAGEANDAAFASAGSAAAAAASDSSASGHSAAAAGFAATATTKAGEAGAFSTASAESAEDAQAASVTAGTAATTATSAAATATTQASSASTSAASASSSATLAASVGGNSINANPTFAAWPTATNDPPDWVYSFSSGTQNRSRQTGDAPSPWAWQMLNTDTAQNNNGTQAGLIGGQGYFVLEADVTLVSGQLGGSGVTLAGFTAGGTFVNQDNLWLTLDPDTSGAVVGAGTAGKKYRFRKLVRIQDQGANVIERLRIMAYCNGIASNTGAGGSAVKTIKWARLSFRSATSEEIAAGVALPALQASVTTTQAVVADLEDQYALARFQVAAVTSGGAAILSLQSDTEGTVAGLTADQIWLGENTEYDNATDTWRTVTDGIAYVRAEGASFGTDGTLRQWFGPSSVAFAAMSRANAYFYFATTAPNIGGTGFGATPLTATLSTEFVSGESAGPGFASTNSVTVTVAGGPAGTPTIRWVKVIGTNNISVSNEFGLTTNFGGTVTAGQTLTAGYVAYVTKGGQTAVTAILDVSVADST